METCRNFPEKPIITAWTVPEPSYKAEEFITGSSYEGDWNDGFGMHGYGEYTFPNGVVYEGEFEYGAMHGKGELRYQTCVGEVIIRGRWENDIMIERTLIMLGTLEYKEKDWKYCKIPDRRYSAEYGVDLQPAGNSFLTAYKPHRKIPPGYYDVGYGVYDPVGKMVYTYDLSNYIKRPADKEHMWILENCRFGKNVPIGPRQGLYETYIQPKTEPAPVPPPESLTKTTKFSRFAKPKP